MRAGDQAINNSALLEHIARVGVLLAETLAN